MFSRVPDAATLEALIADAVAEPPQPVAAELVWCPIEDAPPGKLLVLTDGEDKALGRYEKGGNWREMLVDEFFRLSFEPTHFALANSVFDVGKP